MKLDGNCHFVRIGVPYHITLVQCNHDKDHVHIMFKSHPKTKLTAYKSSSSRIIKKEVNNFKEVRYEITKSI